MNYRGLLLVVVVALMIAPAAPAAACQGPDPKLLRWYDIDLLINTAPLPLGVRVVVGMDNKSVMVSNSGAIPLYIITPSGPGDPNLSQSLPNGWAVTHKLERGALFVWWNGRWVSDEHPTEAMLGLDSLIINSPLNINHGENRPSGDLPPAAPARLGLLYDNERVDVPITLEYSLNPDYDPAEYERILQMHCMGGGVNVEALILGLVLCLFVLGFSVLLFWFVRSAPRPPADLS